MSKRKYVCDHDMEENIKKMRTLPLSHRHKRPLIEADVMPNKRQRVGPAYVPELKQRLVQQRAKVELQTRVHEAERKLQVFRNYFVDIQLKFFHLTNELRACREAKEHVQHEYDTLRRTVQNAQVSWLRCGSHVEYLKSMPITNV